MYLDTQKYALQVTIKTFNRAIDLQIKYGKIAMSNTL